MRYLLFVALPFLFCLAGTGKKVQPVTTIVCREESFINKAITYTKSGDVLSFVQTGDSCVYEYAGDSILLRRYFSEDDSKVVQVYHTDGFGRISTEQVYDHDSLPLSRSQFVYSADGFLSAVESVNQRSGAIFRFLFTYADGDLVMMEVYLNDEHLRTFHYKYDADRKNTLALSQEIPGYPVFTAKDEHSPMGKPSTHLLTEKVIVEANQDTTGHQVFHNRTTTDGRLVSQTMKDLRYGTMLHLDYMY